MLPLLPAQGNGSSQIWQGVSCACLPALSRALPAPQLLAAGCASTRSSAQPCSQLLCSFLQRGPKHLQLCGAAPRAAAGEAAGWTHHGMPKHAQAALHQEHRWWGGGCRDVSEHWEQLHAPGSSDVCPSICLYTFLPTIPGSSPRPRGFWASSYTARSIGLAVKPLPFHPLSKISADH